MRILSALLIASVGAAVVPAAERFEIILRNGIVVDGSGLLPYRADVAIAGGRIARIGTLSSASAIHDVDVSGLYVAPGFINIHSHAAPDAMARAENMLTQGVTTEIINADGSGATDIKMQLDRFAAGGLAVNLGAYVGFNAAWSTVVGLADRRPTADEIGRMRGLIAGGMEAGAWGVSAGLDYKPAYYARTDEVVEVVAAASRWRTNFTNHDRLLPETGYSSRAGQAETLAIAGRSGLIGVVTHMKVTGREQSSAAESMALLSEAAVKGRYAAADAYPYLAGMTGLGALIVPAWAQDGGRQALLGRFADPALRARIVDEAEKTLVERFGGADTVYLPTMAKPLTTVMSEMGAGAGEAIVRLLEAGNPPAIIKFGVEPDLRQILSHPVTSIACDCGASETTATHPRFYGSYPRVLGRYVRDEGLLTWQEAVRKMTALPAATIGLIDRGYLAHGMAADITVFDPKTVIDHATYEKPTARSDGIRHVLVNGTFALRDGTPSGAAGGRLLIRAAGMPSRPSTANALRRVTARGKAGRLVVDLDIAQGPGQRAARGRLKISEPDTGHSLAASEFGVLQVAPNWMSVTAQARVKPGGAIRPVTLIVDAGDPLAASPGVAILVDIEGARAYRETMPRSAVRLTASPGVPKR